MKSVKKILHSRNLAPTKKLGQNFLVNPNTTAHIVELAGFDENDVVVELGVGLGALTMPLAASVKKIFGLEVDKGIFQLHQEEGVLPENVTLLHQDLLKADFHELADETGGRLKIIANLPYSISNPLLFKLWENRDIMESATLMLQKEVGDRLTAQVGTKAYGVLTVLLGSCAKIKSLMHLGPEQFHPRPKVDSVIVQITFLSPSDMTPQIPAFHQATLTKVVKAAFGQRRKKLLNALSSSPFLDTGKDKLRDILKEVEIPETERAEKLTVQDFVRLSNAICHE